MTRARPTDPDARRAQLLAAARAVFARRGYHAAGVSDIIEAAGVARGTFYNYFESKRTVFGAVLDEIMETVTLAVEPIDVTLPVAPQVRANVKRIIEVLAGNEDISRILFSEAAGVDEEGRDTLAAFYGAATGRIERALQTGLAMGVVRCRDTRLAADCLLGTLKEPIFQANLRGEKVDPDALVDQIFAVVTGGILGA